MLQMSKNPLEQAKRAEEKIIFQGIFLVVILQDAITKSKMRSEPIVCETCAMGKFSSSAPIFSFCHRLRVKLNC